MERSRKEQGGREDTGQRRTVQAKFTSRSRQDEIASSVDESPYIVAQRMKLQSLFGGAAKIGPETIPVQKVAEEEPLQKIAEEEPLQKKDGPVQLKHPLGEEEFLPGKFGAAQRVKDEEPLQGKFETAQRTGNVVQMVYIGDQARHHMHVGAGIHQPHYKNGNSDASRINIGYQENYRKADMELVIETIKGRAGESGAQACIDWCKQECRNIITAAGGRAALAAQMAKKEEPLQGKFESAQRVEEEEPIQHKLASGSPAQLEQQPAQLAPAEKRPNNAGLPDNLKSGIETLSGISMDTVRVHYNSSQPAQLNAHAYAQGTDIHVAPGQEHHLPHEAWHVVQQAQGRVQPTMQMKGGTPVNDDKSLEHEADVMGAKALQIKGGQNMGTRQLFGHGIVAQRYKNKGYAPNLQGLEVPNSSKDYEQYDPDNFERPSGWYENTFEKLLEVANTKTVEDPFNEGRLIVLVQCAVTGQACTVDALDIGHKQDWKQYLALCQPETAREATNAYNDLNNLRLESASANRSHDFELGPSGHFKDIPGIDQFGSGKNAKKKQQDFMKEQYGGKNLDEYDTSDPFIDDSEYKKQTFAEVTPIWLANDEGVKSGNLTKFDGLTTVLITDSSLGQYIKVKIIHTDCFDLKRFEGQEFWADQQNLKSGKIKTY
jgi:hypothetical protein